MNPLDSLRIRSIRWRIVLWAGIPLFITSTLVVVFATYTLNDLAERLGQEAIEHLKRIFVVLHGGTLALIISTVFTLWLVAGRIARPIHTMTQGARAVASGHLTVVKIETKDELGVLADAFNQMIIQLRDMLRSEQEQREHLQRTVEEYVEFMAGVGQGNLIDRLSLENGVSINDPLIALGRSLNETVNSLHTMTSQIRKSATDLSALASEVLATTTQQASGANQQAAAISQTTTTVDEVKTISEQSVNRAQEVVDVSQRTIQVSRSGEEVVDSIVANMAQIKARVASIAGNILSLSEQTQQIGDIIATVNELASQSNILALNASVEAARAGEHGKGFAVVAVEVRNLAEQSRQATNQVRAILSNVQNGINSTVMATEEGSKVVGEGVLLAAQAGEVIEQLARVIEESAQASVQVMSGGRQQTTGVEQIALAMQNINQATIQSLASTRQAEKAAQDLHTLAGKLARIVEQYQL